MRNKTKTICMVVIAIIAWFGIILQFFISTQKNLTKGLSVAWSMQHILSYFTIQNNILVALALTIMLFAPSSSWGKFFSNRSTLTAIALYITVVCLVYQIILRPQHTFTGLFRLSDETLHSVTPPLFVLFWLILIPKANLPWSRAFKWLIYPLCYLAYVLIRGAIWGDYPYNFIDHNHITYQQIALNSVGLLFVFLGLGLFFIAIDRLVKRSA